MEFISEPRKKSKKLKVRYQPMASSFNCDCAPESPNKLLTVKFCSKLSSVNRSAQTHECFEGIKNSLFISITILLKVLDPG